jgi:DNA-binding transcriptional LysR family regulator
MELDHIEAIKQAVMAGLGIAFVRRMPSEARSRRSGSADSG